MLRVKEIKNANGNTSNPHYIPYNWSVSNI